MFPWQRVQPGQGKRENREKEIAIIVSGPMLPLDQSFMAQCFMATRSADKAKGEQKRR
jgi:hypothetical protein